MTQFAFIIDYALYIMFATTMALIAYKALHLYKPTWLGLPTLDERYNNPEKGVETSENWMAVLSVIANIGPFIGLVGTVIHIMTALRNMGATGVEISMISGPIATALNATLIGLAAAIPAAIAYQLFSRTIQKQYNKYTNYSGE
jgi:biopolymer transport protein ExbB/TolQ